MYMKNIMNPGRRHTEYDEQGNCIGTVCDPSYYRLLGYENEEEYSDAREKNASGIHPDDVDRVRAHLADCLGKHPEKTDDDIEYRMMTKAGCRWVHDHGHYTRRADGSVCCCDRIIFDIQDLISKTDAYDMAQNHQHFLGSIPLSADILVKANIGLWAFELDENSPPRMYVDDAMLGLIGLEHQVSPEETYHAWYDHIDEGSYGLVAESVEKMTAGEHAEVQYPWHHPNGETWIVRCGGVRNYEYTQGVRIEGTHQNVTALLHFDEEERRRAKIMENQLIVSKFRADSLAFIADNEPDLQKGLDFFGKRIQEISGCDQVIFRDVNGNRTVLNAPGIEDIPQSVCSACPFSEFTGEKYGEDGIVLMDDCRNGCVGMQTHPDCPAKSSFMQRIYSDGELVGLLTVHYLNDYHKFSENGINIMKSVAMYLGLLIGRINKKKEEMARLKAESASKSKTQFLFSMSHDIRTPMNAILGYTDIGLRHYDKAELSKRNFQKIKTAGGHLLNLINDILEMSRIEAGKIELRSEPVDMRRAITNVALMNQTLATAKSIDFITNIESIQSPYVWADELHTNEVIVNLLSNAIKYTPQGGKVSYTVRQLGDAVDGIANYQFEIADNGIGMSDEFQTHLFEAFSREQTASVARIEGAGLGLSIVKNIVDLAGGTIHVKSKLGAGSTFTVELPFRVMSEEEIQAFERQNEPSDSAQEREELVGKRVLLVEDNEMNREIAAEILTEAGMLVEQAEDGEIAVEAVAKKGIEYYDFILMDIQMPVMNGYEATQAIRSLQDGSRIPIIALSANAFSEDKEASLRAGMNDHIAKPIDLKSLFAALAKYSS